MNSEKKHLEITGKPVYPITVGSPALINERDGTRRTSIVISVEAASDTEFHFETQNTVYHLHTRPKESIAGIMIKKIFERAEQL